MLISRIEIVLCLSKHLVMSLYIMCLVENGILAAFIYVSPV